MKHIYILSHTVIIITTRFGKQLAFVDLVNNNLYNVSASYQEFYRIAKEFSFMLQGLQFSPKSNPIWID